jgi:lipopolysaccharide export system permease protein
MLLLVHLAIDFFGKINRLVQDDTSLSMIILFFGLKIPKILFDVAPIGVLVSTLIALGLLSRYNEIVAMKSNGISLLYATSPILITAFSLSLLLGAANLSFIPMTKQRSDYVRYVKIKKTEERIYYGQRHLWLREGRHMFINIGFADSIHRVLNKATIYKLRDDFTLEEAIEAKRIMYENETWMMYEGRVRRFSTDGMMTERNFEKEPVDLKRKPEEFKGLDVDIDKMKFSELRNYINRLAKDGYEVARFRVELYNKISLPFANFVMTLIAIPFGLVETRSRGIARGIGISLLIGSSYWIIHSVALSMGHAGLIPPILAASFAGLLFLSIGIFRYLGIRQ